MYNILLKTNQCLHKKTCSFFQKNHKYMKQNILSLKRYKTEILFFSKTDRLASEVFRCNQIIIKPNICCRYLGVMIVNNLKFELEINKSLVKLATAVRSIYLLRYLTSLKAGILLFISLVLSHFIFRAIFLQTLPGSSLLRINRQIK